jgi:beta-lactamase superfamily II metal-dependent hydrolase
LVFFDERLSLVENPYSSSLLSPLFTPLAGKPTNALAGWPAPPTPYRTILGEAAGNALLWPPPPPPPPLGSLLSAMFSAPLADKPVNALTGWLPPRPPPQSPALTGSLVLRIWDVEHGACAMLHHLKNGVAGRLAMIDSGDTADWKPSAFIRHQLNRSTLEYLFITNADQDHISDLDGLWKNGLKVPVWFRNPSFGVDAVRKIKEQCGPLTGDAKRYIQNLSGFNSPVSEPFNDYMGGIQSIQFWNPYPQFTNTNDLSLVVFIKFAGFSICFPGDLEKAGWLALLKNPAFCRELSMTDILVASHHGRENGYCKEVFDFCHPQAVIMSDKAIVHDTQSMAQTYRNEVIKNHPNGICVATTGKRRHVLTTRRDGFIHFEVDANGNFVVTTEYAG